MPEPTQTSPADTPAAPTTPVAPVVAPAANPDVPEQGRPEIANAIFKKISGDIIEPSAEPSQKPTQTEQAERPEGEPAPNDGAETPESAEAKPDEEAGISLQDLTPDELELLAEGFREYLAARNKPAEAPISPEQAQQQAALQAQPPAAQQPPADTPYEYPEYSEDDLMDAASFNQKRAQERDTLRAEVIGETAQRVVRGIAPIVGMMIDTGIALSLTFRDRPELEAQAGTLQNIMRDLRIANPNQPINEIAMRAIRQLERDTKTLQLAEKLAKGGKLDARTGAPPGGVQSAARPRPGPKQKQPEMSPMGSLVLNLLQASGKR